MKLAYLSTLYPDAITQALATPEREHADYATQLGALEREAIGWAGAWGPALSPLGWEVREVWLNAEPLQRAWAREHGLPSGASHFDIALAQIAEFRPDVLWYDHHDETLLSRMKHAGGGRMALVGWIGSSLQDAPIWRRFDLALSCDPDSVAKLARGGARSALLSHAFNHRLLERLKAQPPQWDVSFVGQLAADHPLHVHRERLLDQALRSVEIAVFSPAGRRPSALGAAARGMLWGAARAGRSLGWSEESLRRVPALGRAVAWPAPPRGPLPGRLRRALRPPRFGLAMYQTLRDSRVTLNIHAGSATRASTNMRLFEATGVGTCLVTDAAENLAPLFDLGREIVTFGSGAELVERVRWLLDHEPERAAIARAGQRRCLESHTFDHRARELDALLRPLLPSA